MILTIFAALLFAANGQSLPPGKGKAIVQQECKGCHALKVVTSKRASKEQWTTVVNQMITRGAEVPDDDIEIVVEYLARNFGPTKKSTDSAKSPGCTRSNPCK
jgi:mono/diheme cytochrome c family protein